MDQEHIPGLALALVDGDRVVWQQGFGSTDSDGGTPVTVDTMFSVQSMSKTFTATAVMRAVQSGLLDLDVPITTYLPDFTVHSAFEAHPERRITLRMLLSHTAGFTHEAPLGNNYEPGPGDFDAHVRSISETWLRFPVGTGYAYSNLGIDLAGYILEQVSSKPFPVVMRDSLLAPLGMDHSTFDRARVHASADRAVGHTGDMVPPRVDCPMTAAGGLWASAADLARFLEFQLGDGTVDGRAVLDAALMQEMRTVPAPHAGAPAGYALGVARTHWRAGRTWTCSTTAAAGTASCRTCGGSRSCSSASPCSPTPTPTTCRERWRWGSCMTWSPSRTAGTTTACSACPPRPTSWSPTATTWHRRTWPPGSRPSRCRRPASSPRAGPDTPSSTAPDSSAP